MTETFLGKPVKKLIIVESERFVPIGAKDPQNVFPKRAKDILLDDLSDKVVYLFPKQGDIQKQLFYVYY